MESLHMNSKERRQLELMACVRDTQLTLVAVAELLPLYHQCKPHQAALSERRRRRLGPSPAPTSAASHSILYAIAIRPMLTILPFQ